MTPTNIQKQLERDEGFRQFPYRDTMGIPTVGIGRNLEHVGISKKEAIFLLQNDVARLIAGLRNVFPWFDYLSEVRKGVLINMAFNMGVSRLLGFKKMLNALESSDYEQAAKEMLDSQWVKQVGLRAERLARQMRTDEWV